MPLIRFFENDHQVIGKSSFEINLVVYDEFWKSFEIKILRRYTYVNQYLK